MNNTVEAKTNSTERKEIMNQTIMTQVASPEVTSPEMTTSQATTSQATTSQATTSQATTSQATTSQATSSQATSSQDTSSQDTSSQDTSSQDTSSQDTSSQDTSSQDTTENQPKIIKTTKFSLCSRPKIINEGIHKARFGVVECEAGTDEKNKPVNRIRVEVAIEHNGNTELIDTYYNIQERGRGIKAFRKDYESWKNEPMSEEMLCDFDGETMSGKELCVVIGHRKLNNVIKPYVKAFRPAQQ